jgi:arsenate reductase
MAEGWLRELAGDRYEVFSAGTHPSIVNPLARAVMLERGVVISGQRSKSVNEFIDKPFDFVITVCDQAAEACPIFPGPAQRIHWNFPDPAAVTGTEEEKSNAFRAVRDSLHDQLRHWTAES